VGGYGLTNEEFKEWKLRHGLSIAGVAKKLGLSTRMVSYYLSGEKPVPITVHLSTRAVDYERILEHPSDKGM